jgi:hypothetical protein
MKIQKQRSKLSAFFKKKGGKVNEYHLLFSMQQQYANNYNRTI